MATPAEVTADVRRLTEIMQTLSRFDRTGRRIIAADDFPKALATIGLKFGDPDVDIVMPMCKINTREGTVDFSGLEFEISRKNEAARTATVGVELAAGSGKGQAFRAALASAIGTDGMPDLPPELRELPQPDRVRKLAGPLHSLFTTFDNGDISVDVFRERLHAMGLRENLEVDRLLRQQGVQFSQLYKALAMQGGSDMRPSDAVAGKGSTRTPSGGVFGTRHNALAHNYRRRDGKKAGFMDRRAASTRDPIGWKGGDADDVASSGLGHERYLLKSDVQNRDTGASTALYGRPVGSTAEGSDKMDGDERFFKGGKAGHHLPSESGAGHALWGYGHKTSFETEAQRTARKGLGMDDSMPVTDHGLHREQIYSAIRQLDRGAINTAAFRLRLKTIGCKIPAEVDRLLIEYDSNGRATFKTFVRSFEKYFEGLQREATAAARVARRAEEAGRKREEDDRRSYSSADLYPPIPTDGGYMDRSHLTKFTVDDTPAAMRSHGDILTWANTPAITLEEHRTMIRDGIRPGQKRRTHGSRRLAAGKARTDDDRRPVERQSRKFTSEAGRRGAGNIIAWASGDFRDESGRPAGRLATKLGGYGGGALGGGELLPDGTPAGLGRARPTTELARKDRAFDAPFGTARDLDPRTAPTALNASRKAFIKSPTLKGGDWMNHEIETKPLTRPVRVAPAPWAKDIEEYEL